jgi:alkylation response protein AidB-like acyl-CoA dehydrogenase
MMNFELNENQKMIQQMVRDFAEKEIRPNMNKWDEEEHFPVDAMKKMGDLGLLGIFIPEQYGGSGFGYFEYVTHL